MLIGEIICLGICHATGCQDQNNIKVHRHRHRSAPKTSLLSRKTETERSMPVPFQGMVGRAPLFEHRPWRVRPLMCQAQTLSVARAAVQAAISIGGPYLVPPSVSSTRGSQPSMSRCRPGYEACPNKPVSHECVDVPIHPVALLVG